MWTILQTPTPNLQASINYYTKLGFQQVSRSPYLFQDGEILIEINPQRTARAGLKLYAENWSEIVKKLSAYTKVLKIENGYLLADPGNTWIYLMELKNADYPFDPRFKSLLGNYAGLSIEMVDLDLGFKIYEILGFEKVMGEVEKGWVSISNKKGVDLSLMRANTCPHLFFNPSLTYFNGEKNVEIIELVRKSGTQIAEEVTHFSADGIVDNIVLQDPGGLGFFLFND